MATLADSLLSFEFVFKEVDDCLWVKYEFYFRWDGESVFRDELLKRSPPGWAGRSPGALCANECDGDFFLPLLRKAIDSREPIYWEPTEPDVIIGFYPDQTFPLIPPRFKSSYADHILKKMEDRRIRKDLNNGILDDDPITMIVFVDAYNWRGCAPYYGTGIGLIMCPTRQELTVFYKQLRDEYRDFVERERLEERIKERNRGYLEDEKEYEEEQAQYRKSWADATKPATALPPGAGIAGVRRSAATKDDLGAWQTEERIWLTIEKASDPVARILALAAKESRPITIAYDAGSTPDRVRTIQPKGVFSVLGYSGIYVSAFDIGLGEERCYRLDRLKIISL